MANNRITSKDKIEAYREALALVIKQRDDLQIVLTATNKLLLYFLSKPPTTSKNKPTTAT